MLTFEQFKSANPTRNAKSQSDCLLCGIRVKPSYVYCETHMTVAKKPDIGSWSSEGYVDKLIKHPEFNGVIPTVGVCAECEQGSPDDDYLCAEHRARQDSLAVVI